MSNSYFDLVAFLAPYALIVAAPFFILYHKVQIHNALLTIAAMVPILYGYSHGWTMTNYVTTYFSYALTELSVFAMFLLMSFKAYGMIKRRD